MFLVELAPPPSTEAGDGVVVAGDEQDGAVEALRRTQRLAARSESEIPEVQHRVRGRDDLVPSLDHHLVHFVQPVVVAAPGERGDPLVAEMMVGGEEIDGPAVLL